MKNELRISLAAQGRILGALSDYAVSNRMDDSAFVNTLIMLRAYIRDPECMKRDGTDREIDLEAWSIFSAMVDKAAERSARARARAQERAAKKLQENNDNYNKEKIENMSKSANKKQQHSESIKPSNPGFPLSEQNLRALEDSFKMMDSKIPGISRLVRCKLPKLK